MIAGDGDDREFLRRVAERLGVAGRVDFAGAVSDSVLVRLYRDCRAFVLPSGQEGFGIVFLEAMFFGAPVIAAAEKGACDVIRDGETGLLVPYGDVVGLARAINRVLDERELGESLRTAARANVTGDGCFTAGAFTRRLAALLNTDAPGKLVFVNRYFHPDESATSRMLGDLTRRLSRAGRHVEVITSRQLYDDADAQLPVRDTVDGVIIHRVDTARRGRGTLLGRAVDYLSFHVAAYFRLWRVLGQGDFVIAKTDPPMLSLTVSLVARMRGAQQINWLQDVFPEVADELGVPIRPWLARLLMRLRDYSLRRAVRNVVIGTHMAERLRARGIKDSSIRVIPNWADTDEIAPRPVAGNPIRVELGLTDRFVIGYSGNLGRAHEFETFLGAAQVLRGDPRFAFLITGGGAKLGDLRRGVETLGLTSFHFQGYQPPQRLADSMAAADVHLVSLKPAVEGLIVPSKYYGILAAGRPAIFIGDLDGELAREIRSTNTGLAISVGDSASLAQGLRRLRDVPGLLEQFASNARTQAEERHCAPRALKAWQSMLAELESPPGTSDLALLPRVQSGT